MRRCAAERRPCRRRPARSRVGPPSTAPKRDAFTPDAERRPTNRAPANRSIAIAEARRRFSPIESYAACDHDRISPDPLIARRIQSYLICRVFCEYLARAEQRDAPVRAPTFHGQVHIATREGEPYSYSVADLRLELRDSEGEVLQSSDDPGNNVEYLWIEGGLKPGSYTLTVTSHRDEREIFGLAWRNSP